MAAYVQGLKGRLSSRYRDAKTTKQLLSQLADRRDSRRLTVPALSAPTRVAGFDEPFSDEVARFPAEAEGPDEPCGDIVTLAAATTPGSFGAICVEVDGQFKVISLELTTDPEYTASDRPAGRVGHEVISLPYSSRICGFPASRKPLYSAHMSQSDWRSVTP
jgi:hypothetical protein